MVAVIKTGHSIHRILNYNENKVKEGVAQCIGAVNYPLDPERMGFNMKLNRLLKQMELNTNVTRNSVHISLNFHASENDMETQKLNDIAENYMDRIGFGNQPYLVYQHLDAAHPHIHIVSIKVRPDGSRIDMNNIGRNQSEEARKSIEKEFNLVRAQSDKKQDQYLLKPAGTQKAIYGRSQTKSTIQNVLEGVISQYHYTSIPELNAVLRQYNVVAERGSENSRVFRHKGLLYSILDSNGKPVGVPIKASAFYNKPTLRFLEERFMENGTKRNPQKSRLRNTIDLAFVGKQPSIQQLIAELDRQGIHVALRTNESGLVYGITYVDHKSKCVFNGSTLGKQYSAKGILERCGLKVPGSQEMIPSGNKKTAIPKADRQTPMGTSTDKGAANLITGIANALEKFMETETPNNYMPNEFKKRRRKRRGK